jgi:xanthine dehydrogenase accessory factor
MPIYQELADCEKNGTAVALCTIVNADGSTPRHRGSKMLVYPDGHISGTIGGGELEQLIIAEAAKSLNDGNPRLIPYEYTSTANSKGSHIAGLVEVYVEPVLPRVTLVVIGGGHVGQKVVHLAKWLDYRVILSDERAEFCNADMEPSADGYLCCKMEEIADKINITSNTYLVLTTKNAEIDIEGLPSLLNSKSAYIGVIGSKRRWENTKNALIDKGISAEQISRVRSPIGLELNAETPQEIAVSILSEIIMLVNSKNSDKISKNKNG